MSDIADRLAAIEDAIDMVQDMILIEGSTREALQGAIDEWLYPAIERDGVIVEQISHSCGLAANPNTDEWGTLFSVVILFRTRRV